LLNIWQQSSINAIIALGMTLVIISGGIDLSVTCGRVVRSTGCIVNGRRGSCSLSRHGHIKYRCLVWRI
jgi:predicted ABC-type sugar transport system permease subunit